MEITGKELEEKINNGEKLVVEFWAPWCGPCRMLKPVFERVASNNETEVQMYTMDIEDNKEFAQKLGIRSIPTTKSFNNKQISDTVVGVMGEEKIKSLVSNLITE